MGRGGDDCITRFPCGACWDTDFLGRRPSGGGPEVGS
jgi:hypothetical protein